MLLIARQIRPYESLEYVGFEDFEDLLCGINAFTRTRGCPGGNDKTVDVIQVRMAQDERSVGGEKLTECAGI